MVESIYLKINLITNVNAILTVILSCTLYLKSNNFSIVIILFHSFQCLLIIIGEVTIFLP